MREGVLMKLLVALALGMAVAPSSSTAQLRSQDEQPLSAAQSLVRPTASISEFLGLLNPDNFMMRHSFSLSYLSSDGRGISMASYTNSMFYKIADPLNVRFDLTLQGSPFGQYGSLSQTSLNKLFVSRAELNYRPSDNMFLKLEYNQIPFNSFRGFYPPYAPYY
ncbi:MAG: hypothetical protein E6K56_09165 [Ignavibacteria bacterium]|nr:MAG: hypothetical protein E6K56_09165 [Ignavibacteria bacterium]